MRGKPQGDPASRRVWQIPELRRTPPRVPHSASVPRPPPAAAAAIPPTPASPGSSTGPSPSLHVPRSVSEAPLHTAPALTLRGGCAIVPATTLCHADLLLKVAALIPQPKGPLWVALPHVQSSGTTQRITPNWDTVRRDRAALNNHLRGPANQGVWPPSQSPTLRSDAPDSRFLCHLAVSQTREHLGGINRDKKRNYKFHIGLILRNTGSIQDDWVLVRTSRHVTQAHLTMESLCGEHRVEVTHFEKYCPR